MGGEKLSSGAYVAKDKGSPPRRRGKGVNVNCSADDIGITPAQAGKSCSDCRCSNRRWDHPRTGGERSGMKGMKSWKLGSPPRRRGKDKAEHLVQDHIGITPAQAGKRCYLCASTKSSWDHPRVGGEKNTPVPGGIIPDGSPPRGRGKADYKGEIFMAKGITPAWAGKR